MLDANLCLRPVGRDPGALALGHPAWPALALELLPAVQFGVQKLTPTGCQCRDLAGQGWTVAYDFGGEATLSLAVTPHPAGGMTIQPRLQWLGRAATGLEHLELLATPSATAASLGSDPARVMILEQGNYHGRVAPLATAPGSTRSSTLVWVAWDRQARYGLLAGFTTSERWLGRVELTTDDQGQLTRWCLGFDGGRLTVQPGQELALEEFVLLAGPDPLGLLDAYAETVKARHNPVILPTPPVSWCSWYPYRLGVSDERALAEGRLAAARLGPLGFRIVEVDLGWEWGNLPSTYTENERFPRGLRWLADCLAELGLELGVWKAPFSISARDPLCAAHPEWLIRDDEGRPVSTGEWYWEPHGDVYILDLSHPGAREYLRQQVASLRARGVRYLKADFIGCASHGLAKQRHDASLVTGGGTEAARLAAATMQEALGDGLMLNCGGPELPGTGHWPLFYTCNDTGNTGFLTRQFMRDNYQTLACHLFKNGRFGVLQPSCLCVGLPGTLEEARLRATLAFLAGGQIDISDTLTTLPEDRWAVLTATLPPLGVAARPVDLFEPVTDGGAFAYATQKSGEDVVAAQANQHPPGSVWHLHLTADWDEWDLVGLFAFGAPGDADTPVMSRFVVPLTQLGLPAGETRLGFEFWSGLCIGPLPGRRTNAGGYVHPGDAQDFKSGDDPAYLDLSFFGPGAKLVCLRRPRLHPWVAGTTFHQSCGTELRQVRWHEATRVLQGELTRPAGEAGLLVVDGAGRPLLRAAADGVPVPFRPGANGAWVIPLTLAAPRLNWELTFGPQA